MRRDSSRINLGSTTGSKCEGIRRESIYNPLYMLRVSDFRNWSQIALWVTNMINLVKLVSFRASPQSDPNIIHSGSFSDYGNGTTSKWNDTTKTGTINGLLILSFRNSVMSVAKWCRPFNSPTSSSILLPSRSKSEFCFLRHQMGAI